MNLRIDEGDRNDTPDTWIHCRVGTIGAVSNGSTPSRKQPEFWDGEISWVSSGQVRNNVIAETRERITKAGYESSSVRILPRGTAFSPPMAVLCLHPGPAPSIGDSGDAPATR